MPSIELAGFRAAAATRSDWLRLTRRMAALVAFAVAALLLLTPPGEAQTLVALPLASEPLIGHRTAPPTRAWAEFCVRLPAECEVDGAEPAAIALDAAAWAALAAVNDEVNTRIKPQTDHAHWGIEDRWDFAEDGFGDCEDFQLLKRRLLVARGLPRRALRMTVVVDETGEGHAVLTARTDRGDFILDNKDRRVLAWEDTAYVFVKREGDDGARWVALEITSSPTATAQPAAPPD